ncbi:MAG: biotin/lipoyl-binding protein [Anaerolineae bacterium]
MRYVAIVNGRELTVAVDRSGGVSLGDTSHSVALERIDGDALLCLFVDGEPHEVFTERRANSYRITIDGTRYDVQVEDEQLRRLGEWRDEPSRGAGEATVISPMPGIVVDVLVEEGQVVRTGDRLVILEAMKMENEIRAPCAGIVEGVQVVPGQTVNLKDVIMSIGPAQRLGAPPDAGRSNKED